jgi:Ca2+-binding EF-hand superfamily protein
MHKTPEEEEDEGESLKYLLRKLKGAKGREEFMHWLFRLADVERTERISYDDLCLVLKAIARDQINARNLAYETDDDDNLGDLLTEEDVPTLSQKIMHEYDTGKTGYLTKDEFMVLADLIVRNYESFSQAKKVITFINLALQYLNYL